MQRTSEASTTHTSTFKPKGIGLEARWGTDPIGLDSPARRNADCTLDTFRKWGAEAFVMEIHQHVVHKIFEAVEGDYDNPRLIKDESDWQATIKRPNTTRDGAPYVAVSITSKSIAPTNDRPSWMSGQPYEALATGHETDARGRLPAFKLSYHRHHVDVLHLLDVGIATSARDMCVNQRPETSQPDYNAESALFPGVDGEEGEAELTEKQQITYEKVQQLLASESLSFNDVAECKAQLRKALGHADCLITGLPTRRSMDPLTKFPRPGNTHKAHQICFLAWALYMEFMYKGGICGDGCGLGKTHEIISLILGATRFWSRQERPVRQPTLVVVPNNLLSKTRRDLHDQLGSAWTVLHFGDKYRGVPVTLDKSHPLYDDSKENGQVVVVVSLEMLSTKSPSSDLNGLYIRIIIDESQGIRRVSETLPHILWAEC